MKFAKKRQERRILTPQEREDCMNGIESQFPGYLNEFRKQHMLVKIMVGIRFVYALFYLGMSLLYDLSIGYAFLTLLGVFIFYLWFAIMLHSHKVIAVMMLVFRGIGIINGGASIIGMSVWLPFPLLFTTVAAVVIEYIEAMFCIYILFNKQASQTVRLNLEMSNVLYHGHVSQILPHLNRYGKPESASEEAED